MLFLEALVEVAVSCSFAARLATEETLVEASLNPTSSPSLLLSHHPEPPVHLHGFEHSQARLNSKNLAFVSVVELNLIPLYHFPEHFLNDEGFLVSDLCVDRVTKPEHLILSLNLVDF